MNIIQRIKRRILIWRVNRALHIRLTDWQIAKIFDDTPFPEDVQKGQRPGKTTAQILFVLLCPKLKRSPTLTMLYGFPPELRVDSVPEDSPFVGYEAARAAFYFGEDGVTLEKRICFVHKMRRIKRRLNRAKIATNPVEIIRLGSKFTI